MHSVLKVLVITLENMPRKPCYWTRKLEMDLVEFVRQRDFIWKPFGNTNHQIQQKYKAYAEFAAKLGHGYSARSVRDRWVNIRSTFNHNQRRVDKSKETARSSAEVYVPCWPLWKPLQFLREVSRKEDLNSYQVYHPIQSDVKQENEQVKEEVQSDIDELQLGIRQRGKRTDRPRRRVEPLIKKAKANKCSGFIQDLVNSLRPLVPMSTEKAKHTNFWFFGKHVTERLNAMRDVDATCASRDIMNLINRFDYANGIAIKSESASD